MQGQGASGTGGGLQAPDRYVLTWPGEGASALRLSLQGPLLTGALILLTRAPLQGPITSRRSCLLIASQRANLRFQQELWAGQRWGPPLA